MDTNEFEFRVKIQQIIENQIPEFILNENVKFTDFLKQYYISQEYQSGPVDISENLDQYLKIDNLVPEVVNGMTSLSYDVNSVSGIVTVTSTKGFPQKYGLLQIDDEIITYTGITTNSFTGCIRGFSGITNYHQDLKTEELVFSESDASSHTQNSNVKNLSVLFLQEFYKKIKYTFTPGLENLDFVPNLNSANFIKEARTFYQTKGTEESFRILFNVLFGETPKIIDLEQFLLKPSSSTYIRRKVIIADIISGNLLNLVGQTIFKNTDDKTTASVSEVEVIRRKNKTYYKLLLFIGYDDTFPTITGDFDITGSSRVISTVSVGSSVISVDSTIGFPEFGKIYNKDQEISYEEKSINQFFKCSGIETEIPITSIIRSNDTYYGYENGDTTKKVEFRITGVLSSYKSITENSSIEVGEDIQVKNVGIVIANPNINASRKEIFANSWIYNTSSRYEIDDDFETGSISQVTLRSNIDKSSLKKNDFVDILFRDTQQIVEENLRVINITENQIVLNRGFILQPGNNYDIRRRINFASSALVPLEFNSIMSDVLNVYDEDNENMYVASNSLPSYSINKSILSYNANGVSNQNLDTELYSIITFSERVSWITGDELYYTPSNLPIPELSEGIYYVEVLPDHYQIRLYSSRFSVSTQNYLSFGALTPGIHNFCLNSQKEKIISPQKILRKFPLTINDASESDLTIPGPVGMLINGIEIESYKSENKIYYGPLESIQILNSGENYDVINPPRITANPGNAKIQSVIRGSVQKIFVNPQDFDLNVVITANITGGSGKDVLLEPVVEKRRREIEFDARLLSSGGGIDVTEETITFKFNHYLSDGEPIIYRSNFNSSLGIGTFKGSNANTGKTLKNETVYYVKRISDNTIQLYESFSNYNSGISTVGFTTIGNSGIHKFVTEPKNTLTQIKVLNGGYNFTNRKLRVSPTGISTINHTLTFKNHGFKTGDLVVYEYETSGISGLSTANQYYVTEIDDNSFRLSNAGVGGTIFENYERSKFVQFQSTGTGYQIFNYPPITLDVEYSSVGVGSTQIRGKIEATPIVRGEIIDVYVYDGGSDYGSSVLNQKNNPSIKIQTGSSAQIIPIIENGRIIDASILYGGNDFYSLPDITIIGDGVGAVLKPVLTNNRISDIVVIYSGIGYSAESTTILVEPVGKNAILEPKIRSLSVKSNSLYGDIENYSDELLLSQSSTKKNETNEILQSSIKNLKYSVCGYFGQLQNEFNDNGINHSPIIGWAYDGNPIYGSYGFSNPSDPNSSIKRIIPGYTLNSSNIVNRPSNFAEGFFIEDYVFTNSGDLDEYNGRYCITPEFPKGIYAYFATTIPDPNGNITGNFPYFIGNRYRSKFIVENRTLNQSFDFNQSNLIRNTFPYKVNERYASNDFIIESNESVKQVATVESVSSGSIDEIVILDSGKNYKIKDSVEFDAEDTGGGEFIAEVSKIQGKDIIELTTNFISYDNAQFVWSDGEKIKVKIEPKHGFQNLDYVNISGFSTNLSSINGSYSIQVNSYSSTLAEEIPSYSTTGIVTDIYLTQIPEVSIGSSIQIENENFTILNIFRSENVVRVSRENTGIAHSFGNPINFISDIFTISKSVKYFESQFNDLVYFNSKQSVGVGSTVGVEVPLTYVIGNLSKKISIPTQSIYLPNHPFKNNQEVTLVKPVSTSAFLVSNTSGGPSFNLPISGNSQKVYILNKSPDTIGIVTQIGLTTTSNGLFFNSNGTDDYRYYFQSNYQTLIGNVDKIQSTIVTNSNHELTDDDLINLTVKPNISVGIGTSSSISIRYDSQRNKILVNPIIFSSTSINVATDEFLLPKHNLKTGNKILYQSTSPATGLSTNFYYVYEVTSNKIKLCETLKDSFTIPPITVGITSAPSATHTISPIHSEIQTYKNNNLVFDLDDSSLIGYKFKIFYDSDFTKEFISTGISNDFNVTQNGIIGVTTGCTLTIESNDDISFPLYYSLEKNGVVISADSEVQNFAKITFLDSIYSGSYRISGVGSTTFNISLSKDPENYHYSNENCDVLKYTTTSTSSSGGIEKIKIVSPGSGFKKIPLFTKVESEFGTGANILLKSKSVGKIDQIRVLSEGYEYSADRTLKPESLISKFVSIKNSNEISDISVSNGGKNYISKPDLIIVNSETGEQHDNGFIEANMNGSSIQSVSIIEIPRGLPQEPSRVVSINNSNGIAIESVQSSSSGIVTCILVTPLNGFSPEPFGNGDKIYVENIKQLGTTGDGLNSEDHQYEFFTVTNYVNGNTTDKRRLEYNLSSFTNNLGAPDPVQDLGALIVNYKNYPQFLIEQKFSDFTINEPIDVQIGNQFIPQDLVVTKSNRNYVKIFGSYDLQLNQKIKGRQSSTIATIDEIKSSFGHFNVDYSAIKDIGWSDNVGKLNEDIQVISDNDYYQNLSYTVKSNQEWEKIVSPVNNLVHTSGLKNFADTQIIKAVGVTSGPTLIDSDDLLTVLYNIVEENRVDSIHNYDLVLDTDVMDNVSKFLKFRKRKFSDYIECRTNRVLAIDDISSQFSSIDGVNGKKSFELNYLGTPIFRKTFNPSDSSVLNLSTGEFIIPNHFFNTGEELIYSSIGASVGIGSTLNSSGIVTSILPNTVYAIRIDNNRFKISTRKDYSLANPAIGVTFTSVGSGNTHGLEMLHKNDKCIISINNVIQSPLSYSLLNYNVNNGGTVGIATSIFGISGISSISIGDVLKINTEYMKVINYGVGASYSGPISLGGTIPLVQVERGFVGTSATTHSNLSAISLYRGSFNIAKNEIYFTDAPMGINTSPNSFTSSFNGRVFLRLDYSTNQVFDDISPKFTGIGQTFTLTSSGINTIGIGTTGANGIVLINGIFQTPTTENNLQNNYKIIENTSVGITSIVFSGVTTSNGSILISESDINQNNLPRGGLIVSLGSTPGMGYAPLVGASVTATISGGSITLIGIGTSGNWGSGYRNPVSIAVTEKGHTGTAATITANVGAGGSLSFNIVGGGTGYINPTINISPPNYSNLPVVGVSRIGIGTTTKTGTGLLLNISVGSISTTGIGSTLFQVTDYKITRSGYGFQRGDVLKVVGLVTDSKLSQPISEFNLTVIDTFTDSFSSWQFGELYYIDDVKKYQNGVRKKFPLYYNSTLLSFEKSSTVVDSQFIDLNDLLIIFINGILQKPREAYEFNGGSSFIFTEAPKSVDNISIYFYRGSTLDSVKVTGINETIKVGDSVQVFSNNNFLDITETQNSRTITAINSSDTLQTINYSSEGIDIDTFKPLSWTKQKTDSIIDGDTISKSRDSIKSQIFPTSRIIRNLNSSDTELFVDDVSLFDYENPETFDGLIVSGLVDPISAKINAVVSSGGTISSLSIISAGSGYTGSSINVKISAPRVIGVGIGTTATATISVINGSLSTPITITNPGFGYTTLNPPQVIVPLPNPIYENIRGIANVQGFSGSVVGIQTVTGIGTNLAIRFTLVSDTSSFTGLSVGYPIYIFDTKVGNGVTSIINTNSNSIGIGTTFLDNIYYINAFNASTGIMTCNIHSGSNISNVPVVGTGVTLGRFSWGRLSGFNRSSSPISIGVSGFTVNSGLTTFPTIQRRGYGLRQNGSIKNTL